jgi:GNAT superfamily N-acetyltransferase
MRRPDRLVGPGRATLEDIDGLNRLFADAFTDRYHRDGLPGVRVPHLHRDVWRFAISDAGEGALVWHTREGALAAFNMVHHAGAEGWMGPLCVRPDLQGSGFGREVVQAGIAWLREAGVRTIGLETMPRTVDNIGFYGRIGFLPGHLTVTMVREVERGVAGGHGERLADPGTARDGRLAECAALTHAVSPGVDYSRVLRLTATLHLGDTTLVRDGRELAGYAVWHTTPLAEGRGPDEVRVLKLVARDEAAFLAVLAAVEDAARETRIGRVSLRCQSVFGSAYALLVARGYRVHWTDLRMTLEGFPERVVAPGLLWSNWEV